MSDLRLPVSTGKVNALLARMAKLGVFEADLEESFIRSGGKGGQNVNKVSTAVRLSHAPTKSEIKCSTHRTQGMNRYAARVLLCEKLEQKERDALAIENPAHKKRALAKLDRARKAKRKAKAKAAKKPSLPDWKKSGEW
jgi:protein subunit release factor B